MTLQTERLILREMTQEDFEPLSRQKSAENTDNGEIKYRRITDYMPLYDFCRKLKDSIPYWFDADYSLWEQSFAYDTDYDGDQMFRELVTYAAVCGEEIVGFIQFGLPCFIYDQNGEKNRSVRAGIIRQLYFSIEYDCAAGLIGRAQEYFAENAVEREFAFFHAFGMTCHAGHGKLHCAFDRVEKAVFDAGFVKEHENVYYRRSLTGAQAVSAEITLSYGEISPKGMQEFTVLADGRYVGAGAVVYLPQGEICYLKWIYIEGSEQGKGYATAALYRLFAELYSQGIRRLDTDTADRNLIAQKLYTKTGFEDMGRTRSYLKPANCGK